MAPFRQHKDEQGSISIHGESFSLPGDIEFFQAPPLPGVPSTRSFRIFAEDVSIDGTIFNGGADIQITCRVLKLLNGAEIDTSGPSNPGSAAAAYGLAAKGDNGKKGKRGLQGFKAGNVSIFCGKVVRVGERPTENSSTKTDYLTARPDLLEEVLQQSVGSLVREFERDAEESAWIIVHAVGGTGGRGQDGQDGGVGRDGAPKPLQAPANRNNVGRHKESHYKKTIKNRLHSGYRKTYKGNNGGPGGRGGRGGTPGVGGDGGAFRFAAACGSFASPDLSTPEREWVPALCVYAHDAAHGSDGGAGSPGRGGAGGLAGQGANYSVKVRWREDRVLKRVHDETLTGQGHSGSAGDEGAVGEPAAAPAPAGSPGTGPDGGAVFSEKDLVGMLDVDHLLQMERAAGKSWLDNVHDGNELTTQFSLIKCLAEFFSEHTDDLSAIDDQLDGLVSGSLSSLTRLTSGANYFGFMPGFVPRTTIGTIKDRINTILPLANTVQEQVESYLDVMTTQDDRGDALQSAIFQAKIELSNSRSALIELDVSLDATREKIAGLQQSIVAYWQGDAELGIKGLTTIQDEFLTALKDWEPPSDGPPWLKIALIVAVAVVGSVAIVLTAGAATPLVAGAGAAAASAGAATVVPAGMAAAATAMAEITATGVDAAFQIHEELQVPDRSEADLDSLPLPITQDMNDTARQIQIETIDIAAASTDGDIDKYATALKNAFRVWLDKCQDRNASIVDYQETLLEREKVAVEVKRLTAQLTRVNEQVAKNNIDPSTPVLAEFMESALDEQKFFLMRELYREHVKLVDIEALPELSVFQVYSRSTVADLSAMHARNLIDFSTFQDRLVQLSTDFKIAIDLPKEVVDDLATEHMTEFHFTELPAILDIMSDIVVHTVAVRIGKGALSMSAQVTAGIYCEDDERAGLCCYDPANGTDVFVATLVGQGNSGARLEGTTWTINLRYASNSKSIYFGKLQDPEGGVQVILTGSAAAPSVEKDIYNSEKLTEFLDVPEADDCPSIKDEDGYESA